MLKSADQEDLARAILAVGPGEAIFGPTIAGRITRFFGDARRLSRPSLS